jgi:ZIP family zinc transporter
MVDSVDWSLIMIGFGVSAAAGLATGAGALPILFIRRVSERLQDALLGFSAGVMLAASFLSLIIPGLEYAEADLGDRRAASLVVVAGVLLGALLLGAINRLVPHEHFVLGPSGLHTRAVRRIWLFVIAITLHNFPEGLAVGVSFGSGDTISATKFAVAIGLQNIPEGLAVATALLGLNYSRARAVLIATATGLVEPIGGLLGVMAVTAFTPLLPWGLGFAAGAMIFVISNEIVPETHRRGHEDLATAGLMIGLALMMFLDAGFV